MSERSVEHATFVVERKYVVSPERAFAAWADPEAKARWFVDSEAHLELDFRVGGRERSRGTAPDGSAYRYEALFQDIVPAQRIERHVGGVVCCAEWESWRRRITRCGTGVWLKIAKRAWAAGATELAAPRGPNAFELWTIE